MAPKKKGKPSKAELEAEAQRLKEEEEARQKAELERLEQEKEDEARCAREYVAHKEALIEQMKIMQVEDERLAKEEEERLVRVEEERVAKEEARLKAIADAEAHAIFMADYDLRGKLIDDQQGQKDIEHQKRGMELKKKHQAQLQKLEAARKAALDKFDKQAKKILTARKKETQKKLDEYGQEQKKEHAEHLVVLRSETKPLSPKWTPETLRHRQIETHFVNLKKFPDAKKHREIAERLEKADEAQWTETREKTIKNESETHSRQQAHAMAALGFRLESERDQLVAEQKLKRGQLEVHHANLHQQAEEQHAVTMRQHEFYRGEALRLARKLELPE